MTRLLVLGALLAIPAAAFEGGPEETISRGCLATWMALAERATNLKVFNDALRPDERFVPPELQVALPHGQRRAPEPLQLTSQNAESNYVVGHFFSPNQVALEPIRRAQQSVIRFQFWVGGKPVTGTGFVVSDRGHVLTAFHVLEPNVEGARPGDFAATGKVFLGKMSAPLARAKVVKVDKERDLALLEIPELAGVPRLEVQGEGREGGPLFSLGHVTNEAIWTSVGRIVEAEAKDPLILYSTARAEAGMSGGPVLSADGKVVGVSTAGRVQVPYTLPNPGQPLSRFTRLPADFLSEIPKNEPGKR